MSESAITVDQKTNKGKPLLSLNGYGYQKDKEHNNVIYWVCNKKFNKQIQCKSRLTTTNLEDSKCMILRNNTLHNHCETTTAEESKNSMKRSIEDSVSKWKYMKTSVVINKLHASENIGDLPNDSILKSRINYRKRKLYPKQPTCLQDITEDFINIESTNGEKFLLHSSTDHSILILGTLNNLTMLCSASHWMADGTFKIVPSIYEQLFTIFGLIHDVYYPLVYVLMCDRKQVTYEYMLDSMLKVCYEYDIETPSRFVVHLDYEIASSNAFRNIFPMCEINRCLFHLTQSIYRHVTSSGLSNLYKTNKEFRDSIKMLSSLSFLPDTEIVEAFESLKEHVNSDASIIYDYFEKIYVKGSIKYTTRSGVVVRNNPLFAPLEWSCHSNVLLGIQRSNNAQEGWHNRMRYLCDKPHPNLGQFFEAVIQEQTHVVNNMKLHLHNALQLPKRNKKDIDRENRIVLLVQKYKAGILNQEEFLIGVTGNFEMDNNIDS